MWKTMALKKRLYIEIGRNLKAKFEGKFLNLLYRPLANDKINQIF